MGSRVQSVRMGAVQVLSILATLALAVLGRPQEHNLPVLFSFSQPSHNVAVYRGADLRNAIASGAVKGFGNLGLGAGNIGPAGAGLGSVSHVHTDPAPVPVYRPPPPPPVHAPAPVITPLIH